MTGDQSEIIQEIIDQETRGKWRDDPYEAMQVMGRSLTRVGRQRDELRKLFVWLIDLVDYPSRWSEDDVASLDGEIRRVLEELPDAAEAIRLASKGTATEQIPEADDE